MRIGGGAPRPWGRVGTVLAWLGAGATLAFTALRVFGIDHQFVFATMISFTPYVAVVAIGAVVIAALLRRWAAALVALLVVAILGFLVLPRAIAGGPHPAGPRLRILSINLRDGNASAAALVSLVRRERIDVVTVEESTQLIKGRLIRAGLTKLLPFTDPQRYDTGIYSRLPLKRVVALRGPDRAIEVEARVAVPGTGDVVIRAVHIHVLSSAATSVWRRMLDELPSAGTGDLRIIAGDFNATLDHSPLRAVLDRGYADAADRAGQGLEPTWPSGSPFGITIDHVLVDRRIGVDRVRITEVAGTDHRAVIADLGLPAQN